MVDLYSGIGGLGLGAARAGFTLALAVDKDEVLSRVHELNFPNCTHMQHDIAKLSGSDVLVAAKLEKGELTGLVGGSPCQGFSRIGKRKLTDERNQLFVHFFRLVSELRPSFYLVENVQGSWIPETNPSSLRL